MKKKTKYPPLVKLAILATITVFVWIGFEVYRTFNTKPDIQIAEEILAPVDPALDVTSLDKIQKRIHLSEEEIGDTELLSLPGAEEELVVEEELEITNE